MGTGVAVGIDSERSPAPVRIFRGVALASMILQFELAKEGGKARGECGGGSFLCAGAARWAVGRQTRVTGVLAARMAGHDYCLCTSCGDRHRLPLVLGVERLKRPRSSEGCLMLVFLALLGVKGAR